MFDSHQNQEYQSNLASYWHYENLSDKMTFPWHAFQILKLPRICSNNSQRASLNLLHLPVWQTCNRKEWLSKASYTAVWNGAILRIVDAQFMLLESAEAAVWLAGSFVWPRSICMTYIITGEIHEISSTTFSLKFCLEYIFFFFPLLKGKSEGQLALCVVFFNTCYHEIECCVSINRPFWTAHPG